MRLSVTISLIFDIADEEGLKSFDEIAKNYYEDAKYDYPDAKVESCFVYDRHKTWAETEKGCYTEEMEEEERC